LFIKVNPVESDEGLANELEHPEQPGGLVTNQAYCTGKSKESQVGNTELLETPVFRTEQPTVSVISMEQTGGTITQIVSEY
jgi:hypothetical protein